MHPRKPEALRCWAAGAMPALVSRMLRNADTYFMLALAASLALALAFAASVVCS